MIIPPIESVETKEQAHDLAVEWQHWQSEQSMSWGESADWSAFFEQLGEKFDLTEEFKENGIC
jgi:hypothetical protein